MNTVRRTNSVIRKIRRIVFRIPEQKYFISGDRACRGMMQNARRRRRRQEAEDESILAWARYEFMKEIIDGFWEKGAVHAA